MKKTNETPSDPRFGEPIEGKESGAMTRIKEVLQKDMSNMRKDDEAMLHLSKTGTENLCAIFGNEQTLTAMLLEAMHRAEANEGSIKRATLTATLVYMSEFATENEKTVFLRDLKI